FGIGERKGGSNPVMAEPDKPPLDLAELEAILKAADPAALLVPRRILRRVIKQDRKLAGPGLQVPHRKSYVIDRDCLLQIADRYEVGVATDSELPPTVLLMPRPDPQRLAATPRGETLIRYWRLLFHCRVHGVLEQRFAAGELTEADLRRR